MKKLILLLLAASVSGLSMAQKVNESDVPAVIKEKFNTSHPGVKVLKWEKEHGNYEAEFKNNGVETSEVYDIRGNIVETEVEIAVGALPAPVTEYLKKNFAGKKIKEATKITDPKGKNTYEVEVDDVDYIFDESGNLLKKIQEKEEKDDDDDKK